MYPARLCVNGADAILITLFRVAVWDSRAVRHLCDERLLGYHPRLAVAIPPLARTILDAMLVPRPTPARQSALTLQR
jgi:hypothetical protein